MKRGSLPQCLLLIALCLSFPFLTGCLAGGREEKTNHVFVGQKPASGAVQVASNKPIDVLSVDTAGKTNFEQRDCGQFILMPPYYYEELRVAVQERNELLKKYNELVAKYNELLSRTAPAGVKGTPTGSDGVTLEF